MSVGVTAMFARCTRKSGAAWYIGYQTGLGTPTILDVNGCTSHLRLVGSFRGFHCGTGRRGSTPNQQGLMSLLTYLIPTNTTREWHLTTLTMAKRCADDGKAIRFSKKQLRLDELGLDVGIEDVISALNRHPAVETVGSCVGHFRPCIPRQAFDEWNLDERNEDFLPLCTPSMSPYVQFRVSANHPDVKAFLVHTCTSRTTSAPSVSAKAGRSLRNPSPGVSWHAPRSPSSGRTWWPRGTPRWSPSTTSHSRPPISLDQLVGAGSANPIVHLRPQPLAVSNGRHGCASTSVWRALRVLTWVAVRLAHHDGSVTLSDEFAEWGMPGVLTANTCLDCHRTNVHSE